MIGVVFTIINWTKLIQTCNERLLCEPSVHEFLHEEKTELNFGGDEQNLVIAQNSQKSVQILQSNKMSKETEQVQKVA